MSTFTFKIHGTSLILCTVVQWQVNQLGTSLECVEHVYIMCTTSIMCTMYIELFQSIIQPVESVIRREITLMDIKTHWQCLLSSSQDLSKCLLTVKMICTLGTHLFPCSLLSFSHVSYQWHCWVLMDGSSGNFLDEGKVFSKERESKTDCHPNNNNEINLQGVRVI